MNTTTEPRPAKALPGAVEATRRELLTELGRIYLEAGLPLAAACEAALADLRNFDLPRGRVI